MLRRCTRLVSLPTLALIYSEACLDSTNPLTSGPVRLNDVAFRPNPVMVTAAVARVECSGAVYALRVTYRAPGVDSGSTPLVAASTCPADLDVLGLLPSTAYSTSITAWGVGVDSLTMPGPTVVTAALPSGLPRVATQVFGNPPSGLTAFGILSNAPNRPGYAFIVDSIGRLRWYVVDSGFSLDFQPQPNGHYVLSSIESGIGEFDEVSVAGRTVRTWTTLGSYSTDPHEFRLTPPGALLLGADIRTVDLSAYAGSSSAQVHGDVLEKVDSAGHLLFFWDAFDHFAITDIDPSIPLTSSTIDWTHSNAIEIDSDGNYLLSSRDFSEITKISAQTGAVMWRWGGVHNQFQFIGDTLKFSFQHAIRRLPDGNYVLFDNGNTRNPPFSRAVEYQLDQAAKTATLVWSYRPSPSIFSPFLGYVDRLPNGNTLVTFGPQGTLHEVSPSGQVTWILNLTPGNAIYRAYRIGSLYDPSSVAGLTARTPESITDRER